MTESRVGLDGSLDGLRQVAERIGNYVEEQSGRRADAELAIKLLGTTMGAYLSHVWSDPGHPAFLPSVGYHQMYGSPDPDTVYRSAVIDGSGSYLVTGSRGSVPDVSVMPLGRPTGGGLRTFRPWDLDDLVLERDGSFQVFLCRQRPPDAPNWWPLEPEMRSLMLRSVSADWGSQVEPRLAIARLDGDPRRKRLTDDDVRQRLQHFAAVVEGMITSGVKRVSGLRADGAINRLVEVDYSQSGGREGQWYHEGCFSLDGDQVLLVEALLQPECRTFSLSLTDPLLSTIDWANAQSSLNQHQAVMDGDGVLRMVVASADPGVHNWLDTAGHEFGVLQCRWRGGGAAPEVSATVLPAAALPLQMPRAGADQRVEAIRARQIGVQLRSQW